MWFNKLTENESLKFNTVYHNKRAEHRENNFQIATSKCKEYIQNNTHLYLAIMMLTSISIPYVNRDRFYFLGLQNHCRQCP